MKDDQNLRNNHRNNHRDNIRTPDAIDADLDQDLRGRFAALRRAEEQQAPDFALLLRPRQHSSRGRARWWVAATCMVMVLAAIAWQRTTGRRPQEISVVSISEWKAPTDFLLETPGRELLRTVPQIGEWPGYDSTAAHARPAAIRKKTSH